MLASGGFEIWAPARSSRPPFGLHGDPHEISDWLKIGPDFALLEGHVNGVAILQWSRDRGFYIDSVNANDFRDRYGLIHARQVHPAFYDSEALRPSRVGVDYLVPIFSEALGADDMEAVRQSLFRTSNLTQPYHSVNVDINKRIRYLD